MICFTFDLDWAPDFMLDELRELVVEFNLPATFYCTHRSPAVDRLAELEGCEVGIHPNFLVDDDEQVVLSRLTNDFPQARGLRNHALYYHSRLLPLLHDAGIEYIANDLLFLHDELAAHYDYSGLVRLPFFWEDDVHCVYFDDRFDVDQLGLERPGLRIFNFHPVHIYLNTRELTAYQRVKAQLRDPEAASALRSGGRGVRTLFEDVARRSADLQRATAAEIARRFRESRTYEGNFASYLRSQHR